jgi:hypothetical protein
MNGFIPSAMPSVAREPASFACETASDYDLLVVMPDNTPEAALDPARAWKLGWDVRVTADIIPCTRREFEEEKDELDSLPRAAVRRGRKLYER